MMARPTPSDMLEQIIMPYPLHHQLELPDPADEIPLAAPLDRLAGRRRPVRRRETPRGLVVAPVGGRRRVPVPQPAPRRARLKSTREAESSAGRQAESHPQAESPAAT